MKLTIIHNPLEPHNNVVLYGDDLDTVLRQHFKTFPSGAVLYHTSYSEKNRIHDISKFMGNHAVRHKYQEYILEIEPQLTGLEIAAIVALVVSTSLSLYVMFTMPKMKAQTAESSNNELANRTNQNRLGGRVPDIYGQVRAYPDLIAESYTYYNDEGVEVERQLLCIGRGYYQVNDMKDATTNISSIAGSSVSVYNPSTSLIGSPSFKIGRTFSDLPLEVIKSSSITGQTIQRPNDNLIESSSIYFEYPNLIKLKSGAGIDFTQSFKVGDSIIVRDAIISSLNFSQSGSVQLSSSGIVVFSNQTLISKFDTYTHLRLSAALYAVDEPIDPSQPSNTQTNYYDLSGNYEVASIVRNGTQYTATLRNPTSRNPNWSRISGVANITAGIELADSNQATNLDGTYTISSLTSAQIALSRPELVNSEWLELADLTSQSTISNSPLVQLDQINTKWIGWYDVYLDGAEGFFLNIHWQQGLYWQSRSGRRDPLDVDIAIEYQQLNQNGEPIGSIFIENYRFRDFQLKPFGRTKRVNFSSRMNAFRFRVSSNRGADSQTVSDAILKDFYAFKKATKDRYEGVTVIQSESVGSDGLYQMKERKLNCLVTRRLPWNGTGALTATKSAAQALIHAALDNHIGRRQLDEVDIQQILDVERQVIDYFSSTKAAEFSYTFDDENLSFEEISGMIASTIFCEDYRFGSKLRLKFDKPQSIPVMLFSEANKVPNSETRTKNYVTRPNFYGKGYDAVEIEYTSPDDDSRINYIASDVSNPLNPMTIKTSGIRTHEQAKTRAWREYNKLKYQRLNVEFTALEESNLLSRNDLILISDGTRIKSDNGYIVSANGNILELSSKVAAGQYFIYVQLPNMSVDIIECQALESGYEVVLGRAPTIELTIDDELTSYQLVKQTESHPMPFLVTEINPSDRYTNSIVATNYDANYYSKDKTFWS